MGWWNPETVWKGREDMDPLINRLAGWDPKMDYASKQSKQFLRRMNAGGDISSEGQFNTLAQSHAVNDRAIDMDFMTGSNALVAGAGGDQASLLNRMRELAKEKERERHGMAMTGALADARGQATDTLQRGYQFRRGGQLDALRAATQAKLGSGTWAQEGGWGSKLFNSAINGVSSAFLPSLFPKRPSQGEAYAA